MNSVFDVFEKLSAEKFSGEVEITSSQGHASVLIKQGHFVWAHRSLDRAVERFQKISWLQMPELRYMPSTWPELALAVVQANSDHSPRVIKLLKMDRLEVFFRIFFWSNLEIIPRPFDVDSLTEYPELSFYSLKDFSSLLAEAKKRVDEWPVMRQRMGSSRRIFMSQIEPSALQVDYNSAEEASSSDEENSTLPQVPFTPEEIELLKHCDGRNTVQDLVRTLPEGEFLIVRRLLQLWRKGAIRPKDDEDSVVSLHARAEDVRSKDILASLWVVCLMSFFFLIVSRLLPTDVPPENLPQEVHQALDVFRKTEGRLPLTLGEIPARLYVPKENLKLFDYSVSDPLHYELKPKGSK